MGDPLSSAQCSELVERLKQAGETGDFGQIKGLLNSLEAEQRISLLRSAQVSTEPLFVHGAARGGHNEIFELLLPETVQHLINIPAKQDGWSCLHFAAAHGHIKVVQWLCTKGMADLNLKDKDGNTPLHLAVVLGRKDVVRFLITAGANLFSRNDEMMAPFSLCKDAAMFEALFCGYTSTSASVISTRTLVESSWTVDAGKRSFLHFTAQFANDPDGIVKLISELDMEQLQGTDIEEDTFLHVAAKSGNMQVLQALRKANVDINELLSISEEDPRVLTPALCALLNNHQLFYDTLIGMSTVKITLRCIIRGLLAELCNKPKIVDRLDLFAATLPTYLALYANKMCIFNFLLRTEIVELSQCDEEYRKTCLHWAILDRRNDIVEYLSSHVQVRPGIQDGDGKTVLQVALQDKHPTRLDILRSKPCFNEYEKRLDRDREIYAQGLNAILVGAALIASVTFAGWLQPPSTDLKSLSMKIFGVSNSVSFFTAVATMCVTTTALIPTRSIDVEHIVNQLRAAIVMVGGLFAFSLAAVVWAFAAAGFAALEGVDASVSRQTMRITTALGGLLCSIVWMACLSELCKRAPPGSVLLALIFPPCLKRWFSASFWRALTGVGANSSYGYRVKSRRNFMIVMDEDLVAREATPSSKIIPLEVIELYVDRFDSESTRSFLQQYYEAERCKIIYKENEERTCKRIVNNFSTKTIGK